MTEWQQQLKSRVGFRRKLVTYLDWITRSDFSFFFFQVEILMAHEHWLVEWVKGTWLDENRNNEPRFGLFGLVNWLVKLVKLVS